MKKVECPFCGSTFSLAKIERNGGACPECDSIIPSLALNDDLDEEEEDLLDNFDDKLDEDFDDSDFGDEDFGDEEFDEDFDDEDFDDEDFDDEDFDDEDFDDEDIGDEDDEKDY